MITALCLTILGATLAVSDSPGAGIVPQPVSAEMRDGTYRLPDTLTIFCATPELKNIADMLASSLAGMGSTATVQAGEAKLGSKGSILLSLGAEKAASESYVLEIKPDTVSVHGGGAAGVFYGTQTLLQLLHDPKQDKALPVSCMLVRDEPRFEWRGLMQDCSRTFLTIDYLKRYVDRLAMLKMNVLHLHLTDDQGWRIEIKKHPELTDIGAKWDAAYPNEIAGYYAQDQLRDLVKYASDRFVTLVPEIEMPSHCLAVLKAHPELSCRGDKYRTVPFFEMLKPGVAPYGVMCPGNDASFVLMEDVITEVVDIFPSKYIHIGGDECPKEFWASCPKCQERKKAEGLKNENELQSYFVKRIEKIVNAHGRTLLGWDEILEGGLAPNAAVMSWRGIQGGIAAAQAGHPVVMSPTSHCYFDYDYFTTPTDKVYAYDPIPVELTAEQGKLVLGAQANMWTHIARTETEIDEMIFPRMVALSEVVWSSKKEKNWDEFQGRSKNMISFLARTGVSMHRELKAPTLAATPDGAVLAIKDDGTSRQLRNGEWLVGPDGSIRDIAFVAENKFYAVGGESGSELMLSRDGIVTRNLSDFPVARIAVDGPDRLWAIDKNGGIHLREKGEWRNLPGKARRIAAGGGKAWALGMEPVAGGFDILGWTGQDWKLVSPGAAGTEISASPDGILWSVNSGGVIWRWDGQKWEPFQEPAQSVAAGSNGKVHALQYVASKKAWKPLRFENGKWCEAGMLLSEI